MEMLVRLATPEALHGVLSVLHARHVEVRHLRYDRRTLRVGIAGPVPQLVAQVARRVDVLAVEVAQVRCAEPMPATSHPGNWVRLSGSDSSPGLLIENLDQGRGKGHRSGVDQLVPLVNGSIRTEGDMDHQPARRIDTP